MLKKLIATILVWKLSQMIFTTLKHFDVLRVRLLEDFAIVFAYVRSETLVVSLLINFEFYSV